MNPLHRFHRLINSTLGRNKKNNNTHIEEEATHVQHILGVVNVRSKVHILIDVMEFGHAAIGVGGYTLNYSLCWDRLRSAGRSVVGN